jgi:hypothetical protein
MLNKTLVNKALDSNVSRAFKTNILLNRKADTLDNKTMYAEFDRIWSAL